MYSRGIAIVVYCLDNTFMVYEGEITTAIIHIASNINNNNFQYQIIHNDTHKRTRCSSITDTKPVPYIPRTQINASTVTIIRHYSVFLDIKWE